MSMFEALTDSFGSALVPSEHLFDVEPEPIPYYSKTVEEAFRRDWQAIGRDMFRAIEKVGADAGTGKNAE